MKSSSGKNESLHALFKLPEDEMIYEKFTCVLKDKGGQLYCFESHLCFYSASDKVKVS